MCSGRDCRISTSSLRSVGERPAAGSSNRIRRGAPARARAPRLFLLDEPAAGLSPAERAELIEILQALPEHIGFIIIEHDMDVALRVAERVTMLHNGRIFKEGTPEEIENDPEVQELYLGEGQERAHG